LGYARTSVPKIREIAAGAAPDRGATRRRVGRFITARVTGSAGNEPAVRQYVIAVLTVDGRRYWAFALTTYTTTSREDLLHESSNVFVDRIIASAAGGRFAAADAQAMPDPDVPIQWPPGVQALVAAGEDPSRSILVIPDSEDGYLSTLEVTPLKLTEAPADTSRPWGEQWAEQQFTELHQRPPGEDDIVAEQVGDWPIWSFADNSAPEDRDALISYHLVQTRDRSGLRMIQTCERGNVKQAQAMRHAVVKALLSGAPPTPQVPAPESQETP
jgi:hypothetical protein